MDKVFEKHACRTVVLPDEWSAAMPLKTTNAAVAAFD